VNSKANILVLLFEVGGSRRDFGTEVCLISQWCSKYVRQCSGNAFNIRITCNSAKIINVVFSRIHVTLLP